MVKRVMTKQQLADQQERYLARTPRLTTRRNVKTKHVRSRHVTTQNAAGDRLPAARYSAWRRWKGVDLGETLARAIQYGRKVLREKHVGTLIFINDQPVYQLKWGNDGRPFQSWYGNPVSQWWRRKLGVRV